MQTVDAHADAHSSQQRLLEIVRRLGRDVLADTAMAVDRESRFPHEAIAALRQERLLSAYIPEAYGGLGCTVAQLSEIAQILGEYCASTAMIWVMHQIQIACIVHHESSSPFFQQYLREAAEKQLLIASITSEVGVGGDVRTSIAHVQQNEAGLSLDKRSTAISYGLQADDFLATARRSADAAPGDQVLVLLRHADTRLTQTGVWDTLGMRGTCSPAFDVSATLSESQLCSTPFAEISTQTMVPFSHLLWSSCWLGIANSALARARKYLQSKARKMRTTSVPGDAHLVDGTALLQLMRANLHEILSEYSALLATEDAADNLSDLGFTIRLNTVKTLSSQLVVQIVQQALLICGMAGYSEASPFSVARHLRDAYSASLMISNDRLTTTNAALLLVHKQQ